MKPEINPAEWQQQQIQSQSEVTLVKFDSELSEQQQGPSLNTLLQKYSLEERVNFIINRDRGEIINVNNGQVVETFKSCFNNQQTHSDKNIKNLTKHSETKSFKNRSVSSIMSKNDDYLQIQQKDISSNVWDDYWEQSQKVHQKLLMSICQKNNKLLSELFNKKLNHVPININYKSFDNWTPIHFACLHGNVFALQLLLSMPQVYINSLTNFKLSALHIAAKGNKIDIIRMLIKSGIELNFQDEDGNSALHYAVQMGNKDIVGFLLEQPKINAQLKNNIGNFAKEMNSSNDIQKIFNKFQGNNSQIGGFFQNLRNNRHVEKLMMKVNQNYSKKPTISQQPEISSPIKKKQSQNSQQSSASKNEGKKQSMMRMYQLLKQKKTEQKIGIESFKFYKKIGEGAFGQVYIVRKGKSQKLYALKAIKKQSVIGTSLLKYIKFQKQVMSFIQHPFIVSLHFAFQTQTHLFLVMDYCPGGDLGKFLERQKKFDERTCKYYAAQILLALQALHNQKIIYRDLKPDNIVLDSEGHALLTDFGLSKKTSNIDDINKSFCGTPAYLPLQIINRKGHNRMADWYQYGVVLYELYTGIPPFYADTRAQLYQNVRAGIIRFPRGTPQNFRDIIKRLLSQNPQKRLGFNGDAEQIKNHKWFSEIDWDEVEKRQLPMPKPNNKVIIGQPIKSKFSQDKAQKFRVSDWSFIVSSSS